MTNVQVVVRSGSAGWRTVGSAHRHVRGGGWNILLRGGVPQETMVLLDAGEYAPGTRLRVLVTRRAEGGGTAWSSVGHAWVSQGGRAVLVTLDVVLPDDERKIVILPYKGRA